MEMKQCSTCKQTMPKTEFFKNKSSACGVNYECKACSKIRNARRQTKNSLEEMGNPLIAKFLRGQFS